MNLEGLHNSIHKTWQANSTGSKLTQVLMEDLQQQIAGGGCREGVIIWPILQSTTISNHRHLPWKTLSVFILVKDYYCYFPHFVFVGMLCLPSLKLIFSEYRIPILPGNSWQSTG